MTEQQKPETNSPAEAASNPGADAAGVAAVESADTTNYRNWEVISTPGLVCGAVDAKPQDQNWVLAAAIKQSQKPYRPQGRELGWDDPTQIATELPGLFGVLGAAEIIAMLRGQGTIDDQGLVEGLNAVESIADRSRQSELSAIERFIVRNMIHSAWRSSQGRDMRGDSPRTGREVSMSLILLDQDEIAKDDVQAGQAVPIWREALDNPPAAASPRAAFSQSNVLVRYTDDSIFEDTSRLLRDTEVLLDGMNTRIMAHSQMTGDDLEQNDVKTVSQMFACDAAVNVVCALRYGAIGRDGYVAVLADLASGGPASPVEKAVFQIMSKSNWRVGLVLDGPDGVAIDSNTLFASSSDESRELDLAEMRLSADIMLAGLASDS